MWEGIFMRFASKVELSAGIITGVLALVSSGFFIIASKSSDVLRDYLLYVGLALLVTIDSYIHVIRGRIAGLVILLLSGLILTAMGLLGGIVFYARGLWLGVPVVLPCVSAAVIVIAAIMATKARHVSG
jgi:hypothetical protein